MGRAKEEWLRRTELQWSPGVGSHVCSECVCDEALADVVRDHAEHETCDYCGLSADDAIAAPLSVVTEHIARRISTCWTDPAEELMYISKEGGYQGDVLHARDLFDEIGYQPENMDLWDDIIDAFSDGHWCKKDYALMTVNERLSSGWDTFVDAVKHQRRFTFWSMGDPHGHPAFDDHPDNMPVGRMLDRLAAAIREIGLIREISPDTPIWRVRVHEDSKKLTAAHELAPPPRDLALQPNRMSPAGIPMFYGAEDFLTASVETLNVDDTDAKSVTGAIFQPTRPLRLLDLFDLPAVPSFWRDIDNDIRETIIFMRRFEQRLSEPIQRGRSEHIDYVPTQAFSEYVRYQMKTDGDETLDGIRFRSSKNGKACYVIFCEAEQCEEPTRAFDPEQLLRFASDSLRREAAPVVAERIAEASTGSDEEFKW